MFLVVHEVVHLVLFGKTLNEVIFVLIDSFKQIVCYANIKSPVPFACKHIDVILFHFVDSCLRRNDILANLVYY